MNRTTRGRLVVLGLFVMFLAPIVAAYWLNFASGPGGGYGDTSRGELLNPTPELPAAGLHLPAMEKSSEDAAPWLLMVVAGPEGCDARCDAALTKAAQVRVGLGKNRDRARRLLVVVSSESASSVAPAPDLAVARATLEWAATFTAVLPRAPARGDLFLVDPRRFIVLRFPSELEARLVLKDLERLLRISKIG
ncbi:MAG: hypothetical protein H6983_20110 [Ectothiorhodospiraceae bacterium]|nr:hypothetical protein [Chromatiales bacterium]MCP5156490.1 hypothetical protein [Ectothiorhodospiraceae bacterium]